MSYDSIGGEMQSVTDEHVPCLPPKAPVSPMKTNLIHLLLMKIVKYYMMIQFKTGRRSKDL